MERSSRRAEWLRLMRELATLDRDAYRRLRSEVWAEIAASHARKSPTEISDWMVRAN